MPNSIPLPQANDMNKIIKLVMSDELVLIDKQRAREVIGVTTIRQVAYYLSALLYLKYLTHDKKFTDRAKAIRNNEMDLKRDIYQQLMGNEMFSIPYNTYITVGIVNIDNIKFEIAKSNPKMADSTINRRASTIRSWVEWMYTIDKEKLL